jgi:GT2 family glycosyltransferase
VNVSPSNNSPAAVPLVSVVILNYHGARYLERCLASLRAQTIFERIEVIVADNASGDGSPELAEKLLAGWPRGRFVQNGANLGYCEGNNRAVAHATGQYLFILNFDAWLEPDCLERLVAAAESTGAGAASPWVLNYDDDTHQSFGGTGMDWFGLPNAARAPLGNVGRASCPPHQPSKAQATTNPTQGGQDARPTLPPALRQEATPHPTLSPVEAERVNANAGSETGAPTPHLRSRPAGTLSSIPNGGEGRGEEARDLFCFTGCSFLIERQLFHDLGGFDADFFLYCDETDLSWRVWIAGRRIVGVPSARVHHRGAVTANPAGGTKTVESRTTHSKRYYANRNAILFLAKNSQHMLLLLLVPHLLLLALEALAALVLVRRWSFVREAYLKAVADAWRMRGHIGQWRARIRGFRQRGDLWMLRFLRLKPSRWEEVVKLFKVGAPKVDAR